VTSLQLVIKYIPDKLEGSTLKELVTTGAHSARFKRIRKYRQEAVFGNQGAGIRFFCEDTD
jgi:hypothetical protein